MLSKSTLSICIGACLVTALPTLATVHASTANNVSIYAGDDPVIDPITKELLEGDAARDAIAQAQAQQSSNITITNKSQGAVAPAKAAWTDLPADAPILPLGDEVVLEPAKNISIGEQNGAVIDSASAMVAAKEANTPVEKARRSIAVAQAQEEAQKKAQEAAKAQQEANEAQAKANAALAEQARARAAEIAMQNSTAASQGQSQTKADAKSTADAKDKISADAKAKSAKSEDKAVVAATSEQKTADESAKKRAKDRADAENVSKAIAAVKEHYNAPYDDKADKRLKDRSKDRVKSYGTNKTASEYQYVAKPMLPEKPAYKQAKVGTAWDPEKNRVTSYPSSIVTAATNAAAATASVNAAVIASAQSVPDHGPFKGTVTTLTQSQAATQNQAVTAEQQAQAQQQALAAQAPAPQGKAHGGSNLVAVGSSIEVPGTQDTSSAPVREQLVKVFGTNTPSMVGTVEEVAAYRKELANNQNVNYTNPPSVYTYTDQYGNVVTVENPNQYDVNYDIYLYDYIGSHGQLPPGWEGGYPPPGWQPPPGWVPPTGANPPPGWPPNHPGWRPPPGWQPPAGWQPPPGWPPHYPGRPPSSSGPSYAPPPGMHESQHPIMPGTPGWPADPGVHYVQPRK